MIASPRPKIFDSRFAKPLRIRGLKEGRLISRLTLTQVVSHESALLEPAALAREGKREIEFILRLQFRQVVSQRSAMGSDTASACDRGLLD
jgi:hypothetical protein